MKLSFLSIFLICASSQGAVLTLALVVQGRRYRLMSNYILSFLILFLTFYLFKAAVSSSGLISSYPHLVVTGFLFIPAIPALFYAYLRNIVGTPLKIKGAIAHFTFFIFQTVYWAPFFLSSVEKKFGILRGEIDSILYSNQVGLYFELAQILQHFIYIILIWKAVKKVNSNKNFNTSWVKKVAIFFTIYAITFALGTLSFRYLSKGMPDVIFYGFMAFFIYLIGYYGYTNKDLLYNLKSMTRAKYFYVDMSQNESQELYDTILHLIKKDELFLHPGLKITDISKNLDVSVNKVSRAINENKGSFSDLINTLRVQRAMELLEDNRNDDKLFSIALDSGFGNKVSFYKNFKNIVGKSPSEFRKEKQKV